MAPRFADLERRLTEVAKVPERVPEPIAEAFNEEIEREFVEERDAYGNAWAELSPSTIARKGHDRILYETGAMLDETKAVARGAEISFVGTEYGPYHQGSRPVPPNESELPKTWQEAIATEFGEAVSGALKT